MVKMFIQKAIKNPGALHSQLHVPQGQKIPKAKLAKAAKTAAPGSKLAKRLTLAKTLSGLRKVGGRKHG